jgi:hypothetical protein
VTEMGRTIPSYRMDIEAEIRNWKSFSTPLRKTDKVQFEELMTICRLYTPSASAACRTIPSDAMFMSILLHHQKLFSELKSQIEQLKKEKITSTPTTKVEAVPLPEATTSQSSPNEPE